MRLLRAPVTTRREAFRFKSSLFVPHSCGLSPSVPPPVPVRTGARAGTAILGLRSSFDVKTHDLKSDPREARLNDEVGQG